MPWMLPGRQDQRGGVLASIRPRHQCRGCREKRGYKPNPILLQFGHDTNAVDATVAADIGVPQVKLQFGHDTNAVDAPGDLAGQAEPRSASIRPRHQCRGCGLATEYAIVLPDSFNSATTPMPWMQTATCLNISPATALQFGHDTNAVDATAGRRLGSTPGRWASIRPRHQCRGCTRPRRGRTPAVALQFGHDTNAVDAARLPALPAAGSHASIRPRHQCRGCDGFLKRAIPAC